MNKGKKLERIPADLSKINVGDKVFYTRYSPSEKIVMMEVVSKNTGFITLRPPTARGTPLFTAYPKDIAVDTDTAKQHCEVTRAKKIASLKKQLVKWKEMEFIVEFGVGK